jgi:tRNA-splicing ligase RtcB
MPERIGNVLSWGSDVEKNTIEQAAKASRLPFVKGHLALMPDAHVGMGATIGSVIPTQGAIIPSAVGVDIGCGMIAAETELTASDLPEDMARFLSVIERVVPAGVGKGHAFATREIRDKRTTEVPTYTGASALSGKQTTKVTDQFGTLGSGNHFVEVCLDERDRIWVVLHSGSRGIGNQLATQHIEGAKGLMEKLFISLEDPDLAYLVEDTPEFDAYIADMLWAQEYARANREAMMDAVLAELWSFVGTDEPGGSDARARGGQDQLPSQLHRAGAPPRPGRLADQEGGHPGRGRRPRGDPWIDGYVQLHRSGVGKPGQLPLLLSRRGSAAQPVTGQERAISGGLQVLDGGT